MKSPCRDCPIWATARWPDCIDTCMALAKVQKQFLAEGVFGCQNEEEAVSFGKDSEIGLVLSNLSTQTEIISREEAGDFDSVLGEQVINLKG